MSNPIISRMSVLMGIPPRPKIISLPESKLTIPKDISKESVIRFPTINNLHAGQKIYCVAHKNTSIVEGNESYANEYITVSEPFYRKDVRRAIRVTDEIYKYSIDISLQDFNIIRNNYNLNRAFYLKEDAELYLHYCKTLTKEEIEEINNEDLGRYNPSDPNCKITTYNSLSRMTLAEELDYRRKSIEALEENSMILD